MLDFLLTGGYYPDFEKKDFIQANIGIEDGRIAFIGPETPPAAQTVDCSGCIVSPGFIDIHMHEEDFSEGLHWTIAELMAKQGVTLAVGGNCGTLYQPVAEFRKKMAQLGGAPVNYVLLSGYNRYRQMELGLGHYEASTPEQRAKLRDYVKKDLQAGAFGISFGIEYDPAITADEIVEACSVSDDPHLLIAAHYREDGALAVESVREMIGIQKRISGKFQISHLSSCSAMGKMQEALELINRANEEDPRLNYDTYPYNAFSTTMGSTVFEDGCFEAWHKDYGDILLTQDPYRNVRCTREIFEDARARFPLMLAVAFVMNEDEISMAISNPHGMIGSDGILQNGLGHPRAAGTFPRVLGRYVREDKALPLIDALRKMTLEPARRLELDGRKGIIKTGADADITVFDPKTVLDGATFADLSLPNQGICCVFVNGKMTVRGTELVDRTAGTFIPFRER